MISKDLNIARMLKLYPQTLEVLLKASPHFQKLNNAFLRKTVARRVNIEQAAAIAGVNSKELIMSLNDAVEHNCHNIADKIKSDPEAEKYFARQDEKPELLLNIPPEKIIDLDVRPDIQSGSDPFLKIKNTVDLLKEDEALHLINIFEPVPLYFVLGKRGYAHWTEKVDSVWHIYFYKGANNDTDEKAKEESAVLDDVIELDVRELAPPEPMMQILNTLPRMTGSSVLVVHHHREPMMLYDKLSERGFTAVTNKINDNYYKVIITKNSN